MKIKVRVQMHSPDWDDLSDALDEAAKSEVGMGEQFDSRRQELSEAVGRWFTDEEYVEIEVDTDAGTAVVCQNHTETQ